MARMNISIPDDLYARVRQAHGHPLYPLNTSSICAQALRRALAGKTPPTDRIAVFNMYEHRAYRYEDIYGYIHLTRGDFIKDVSFATALEAGNVAHVRRDDGTIAVVSAGVGELLLEEMAKEGPPKIVSVSQLKR